MPSGGYRTSWLPIVQRRVGCRGPVTLGDSLWSRVFHRFRARRAARAKARTSNVPARSVRGPRKGLVRGLERFHSGRSRSGAGPVLPSSVPALPPPVDHGSMAATSFCGRMPGGLREAAAPRTVREHLLGGVLVDQPVLEQAVGDAAPPVVDWRRSVPGRRRCFRKSRCGSRRSGGRPPARCGTAGAGCPRHAALPMPPLPAPRPGSRGGSTPSPSLGQADRLDVVSSGSSRNAAR
jgi:hypothetical protein